MKKKLIASLIAASMLLTLSACGGKDPAPDSQPTGTAPTEQATDSEPVADTQDAPDVSESGNANKATETGVYLYDGTFLETGKTVKISDSGASIDMPSVTVHDAKAEPQPDGTYKMRTDDNTFVMDGTSLITDGRLNARNIEPHKYGSASADDMIESIIYNNTDEDAVNGTAVYMQFSFNDGNTTSNYRTALEINGNPTFSLDEGRTLENLISTYGEPAGAYCQKAYSLDGNLDRPGHLYYIWKSGNYPDKTLIMAYEIQYSWSKNNTDRKSVV